MSLWLGILGSSLLSGGDFESIATVTVGSGGAAEVVLDSIPSTYQHLQLRYLCRSSYNPSNTLPAYYLEAKVNAATGNEYSFHEIYGDGSAAVARGFPSQGLVYVGLHATADSSSNVFGAGVVDILDYSNTSKATTFRSFSGADNNGSGRVQIFSSVWPSTAALTKLTIAGTFTAGTIAQHSIFALYGIKAP